MEIRSDQDPRFTAAWWGDFTEAAGQVQRFSLAYRLQENGAVEQENHKVLSVLRSLLLQRKNSAPHWHALLATL